MENPAYDVLEAKLAKIKKTNVGPVWLAGELLSAHIIGCNDEQKARIDGKIDPDKRAELVQAVMGCGKPGAFETFVDILRKEKHLEWLAKELKDEFIKAGGKWKYEAPPPHPPGPATGSGPPPGTHPVTASSASPHTPPLPAAVSEARPTINQLYTLKSRRGRTLKVIQSAAPSWRKVALALNLSPPAVDGIEISSFYQIERACETSLCRWMSEAPAGQPVCWATLLQALRDADLNSLATDLQLVLMENAQ